MINSSVNYPILLLIVHRQLSNFLSAYKNLSHFFLPVVTVLISFQPVETYFFSACHNLISACHNLISFLTVVTYLISVCTTAQQCVSYTFMYKYFIVNSHLIVNLFIVKYLILL